MKFEKGHDARRNTKGRPPGTKNKTSEAIRSKVAEVLDQYFDKKFTADLNALEPGQRLTIASRLLSHVLPAPLHDLERLSDDQLMVILEDLRKQKTQLVVTKTGTNE